MLRYLIHAPALLVLILSAADTAHAQWATPVVLPGPVDRVWEPQLADFTGDGRNDVVVITDCFSTSNPCGFSDVILFRGQPSGVMGLAETAGTVPAMAARNFSFRSMQSADLDADGDLDLVVMTSTTFFIGEAWVLINDGMGSFGPAQSLGSAGGSYSGIQIEDFDQDGQVDIAIGEGSTMTSGIYFGLGQGAFGPRVDLVQGGVQTGGMLLVDFDGDGDRDVLLGSPIFQGVSATQSTYFFENQNGFPISPSAGVDIGRDFDSLVLGDVDGDGDADIVASERNDFGLVSMFEQLASGGFGPETPFAPSYSVFIERLALTDADGDGDIDLLLHSSGRVTLAENLGSGAFAVGRTVLQTASSGFEVGDQNGDGVTDVITTGTDPQSGRVNLFQGALGSSAEYELGEPLDLAETPVNLFGTLAPLDMDGDGVDEVLAFSRRGMFQEPDKELLLKRRDPSGDWPRGELLARAPSATATPVVADFDGDGLEDFALRPGNLDVVEVYLSDGGGGFAPAHAVTLPGPGSRMRAANLDGDAFADIVFTLGASTSVGYAFGAPGPGFSVFGSIVGSFTFAVDPLPVDLDGDGLDDLVYLVPNALEFLRNAGNGTFEPRVVLTALSFSLSTLQAVDVDVDGLVDLVLRAGNGQLFLLRNLGGGAVTAPTPLMTQGPGGSRFFDVDADGLPDLLDGPASGSGSFSWARNGGPQGFGPFTLIQGVIGSGANVSADPDGDGDEDLIIRQASGGLMFVENTILGPVGTPYCGPGVPNSTGAPASLQAIGSIDLETNRLRLDAESLPPNSFGFFIVSRDAAFVTTVPNSVGTLCLGGAIGRFIRPDQVFQAASNGTASFSVDLAEIPSPIFGLVPVAAGDTWHFQGWHRDTAATGTPTSNFTEAVRVQF